MKLPEHMMSMPNGFKMCAKLDRQAKKVSSIRNKYQKSNSLILYLIKNFFNIFVIFCVNSLVLPRIMFERFTETDYSYVLTYETARDDIAELIVQTCKHPKHKFDGIVLEVYFQLAGRVQDKHLLRLVEHLGG